MILRARQPKPFLCWDCGETIRGAEPIMGADGWQYCWLCGGACACCRKVQCNCEIAVVGETVCCLACRRDIAA